MSQTSTRFTLQVRDFLKGAVVAVVTPVLTFLLDSLSADQFVFNEKKLYIVAISAFIAYLLKNYFTDDVSVAQKVLDKANAKSEGMLAADGPGGGTNPNPGGLPPKP